MESDPWNLPDMHANRERLMAALNDTAMLLSMHGEKLWSEKIRLMLAGDDPMFRESDYLSILSWFGGMGSFSDLFLSAFNGDDIQSKNEDAVNERLRALQSEIYELANYARRRFG